MRHVHLQGFQNAIEQRISDCSANNTTDQDSAWQNLQQMIVQTAKENKLPKPTMKPFTSAETTDLISRRREVKEKELTLQKDRKLYEQLSTQVQKGCRKDYDDTHQQHLCGS